jgi:hypothetical protein
MEKIQNSYWLITNKYDNDRTLTQLVRNIEGDLKAKLVRWPDGLVQSVEFNLKGNCKEENKSFVEMLKLLTLSKK